jgi:hypothetical protein
MGDGSLADLSAPRLDVLGDLDGRVAAALCHDPVVEEAFEDGILWVNLGRRPEIRDCLTQLYAALTGARPSFANEQDASSENIQCGGQRDFHAGGAPPSLADLHGLANRYR